MISTPDRRRIITLINEAVAAGARLLKACDVLNLSMRTIQRWRLSDGTGLPPFGMPVATLGIRLSLLHIRLVLCSPVPSVVALGCNSFCRCLSLVGHPTG